MVKCEECGWEGEWEEVLVEVFEGDRVVLARDPLRVHLDSPCLTSARSVKVKPFARRSEPEPLPARLKRLREAKGMSQRALARACGLTSQAVSLIEAGRRGPTLATVRKLAEALGVGLSELAG